MSNVPFDTDEDSLRELFEEGGFEFAEEERSVLVDRHEDGSSKGVAYLRMRDGEGATAALALSGTLLPPANGGDPRPLWIAKCFSKSPLSRQSDAESGDDRLPAAQRLQAIVQNMTRLPLDPVLSAQAHARPAASRPLPRSRGLSARGPRRGE